MKKPPSASKGIWSDIRIFLFNHPKLKTFIKFRTFEDRLQYRESIMQRIGMDASNYAVLNLHQIGIEAPVHYVFEELLNWNGDSTCWPNHIAKVYRIDDKIENIKILPFGRAKYPFGLKNGLFGVNFIPLFNLHAIKILQVPGPLSYDNERYLLYESSGGYPIGFFTMYVRSSIAEHNEKEQTQLFFGVGFDFYGNKNLSKNHIIVRLWSLLHNRVTGNVLNRFKQLCEWRIDKIKNG